MASGGCRECDGWPAALTAARYAYELAPPADHLVHGLKYEGWRELAPFMGDAMAHLELPAVRPGARQLVVPVPTTARRRRSRGYNQAELLAERIAEVRGLSLVPALARPVASESQTTLHPEERRRNVRGAFRRTPAARAVQGAAVLLVDDVLTTGATACAAAEALVAAGARDVVVVTFARAVGNGARAAA